MLRLLRSLRGSRDVDVVVDRWWLHGDVGGLALEAAWSRRLRVVLLEADRCGFGPSGRNGGFCNVMWFSLPNMRGRWGDAGALAVARAAEDGCRWNRRVLRDRGRRCLVQAGRVSPGLDRRRRMTAFGPMRWPHVRSWVPATRSSRSRRSRLQSAVPLRRFAVAPSIPGAATVQPARLALGLRERLRARGVEVFERSPVTRLAALPGGVEAHTVAGAVRAQSAVLAVGAAAKAPRGPLRQPSPLPPRTSSSPSRSPSCWRRSAGPAASASPTAAP